MFRGYEDEENLRVKIWQLYQQGLDYFSKINLVDTTNQCHRMYTGDQWYGLNSGGENMPMFNVIKGIVKYKTAMVAQNTMSVAYSNMGSKDERTTKVCEALDEYFRKSWENAKMDSVSWRVVKRACIQRDSYLYFGTDDVSKAQIIPNVNIMLADEQNTNLQEQEYLIITERLPVNRVKEEAKKNKLKQDEIDNILSDEEKENQLGDKNEVESKDGKCLSLLFMYKDEQGIVHYLKMTKDVVYLKDTQVQSKDFQGEYTRQGLKSYPVANIIWEEVEGSARGCGEVQYLIPNQIELNKTLARRSLAIKQNAYGKLAYAAGTIDNPQDLDKVGTPIAINSHNANDIRNMITYLNPQTLSPDAKNFSDELISTTKELAGAGDSATGAINPEQASGSAIIAVRDQAALPLNEQIAMFRQFVEDIGRIWYDIWVAFNPQGITVTLTDEEGNEYEEMITAEELEALKINVRVDVSQNNPYSKYTREQALSNLFMQQQLSFEEYVEALDKDSNIPKDKLEDIINKRKLQQEDEKDMLIAQQEQQIQQLTGALNDTMGVQA